MLRLTIWMNMPAPYQVSLFEALAALPELDFEVIFARPLPNDRLQLGWNGHVEGAFHYRFLDQTSPAGAYCEAVRIAWEQRDRFHIVNGIWNEHTFTAALMVMILTGTSYAIYAEAPDQTVKRSLLRRAIKTAQARLIGFFARGLLSISHLSSDFYASVGFAHNRDYTFGYFQDPAPPPLESSDGSAKNLLFVGQLIHRKAVDVIIEASAPLLARDPQLQLTLIGVGAEEQKFRELVAAHGCADQVCFKGAVPYTKVRHHMREALLLLLPSRWDGWGLVVNEAFAVGTPVIVSGTCGAADLVQHEKNGFVVPPGNIDQLREALQTFLDHPEKWQHFRERAQYIGDRISTDVVAPYLVECVHHMQTRSGEKPIPPWMR